MKKQLMLSLAGLALAFSANADKYWLSGTILGGSWEDTELKLNEATGKYELLGDLKSGNFGIKVTDDNNSQIAWYSAPNSPATAKTVNQDGTYKIQNSNNTDFTSSLTGYHTIALDWNNKELSFTTYAGEIDETVSYALRGDCFGGGWTDKQMTEDNGNWTWTGNLSAGSLGIKHLINGAQKTWLWGKNGSTTIDGNGTYEVVPENEAGANFIVSVSGEYTLTFNPETMQLTVQGEGVPDTYPQVFVMSDRNGFNESQDFKMATTDGTVYTLHIPDAGADTAFKFMVKINGQQKWFSNGEQNIHNGTYDITTNDDKNMTLHTGGNVDITLSPIDNFTGIRVTIEGQIHDADPNAPIYLVGDMTAWEAEEAYRLTTTDGINYTLTAKVGPDDKFKFQGKDAHGYYFSNGKQNMLNGEGYELNTNPSTGDMTLLAGGDNVTFNFVLADDHKTATLSISGQEEVEDEFPRMYLIGERTEWAALEKYRMSTTDGKTYTLHVADMSTKPFRFCGGDYDVRPLGYAGADLADGNYTLSANKNSMTLAKGGDVTFTLTTDDDFATATLNISGQGEVEEPAYPKMYLIGAFCSWDETQAIPMEVEDGVYTLTKEMAAGSEFKFFGGTWGVRELTTNAEDRLSLTNDTYPVFPVKSEDGVDYNMALKNKGNVTFTLIPMNNEFTLAQLTIEGVEDGGDEPIDPVNPTDLPETLYAVGEINGNGWDFENGVALTKESDGVFTLTNAEIKGTGSYGYFSFTTEQGTWDNCGDRYQDANGDGGVMEPVDGVITGTLEKRSDDAAFEVVNGTYDITVDLNTMKLTMTVVSVDPVEPDDPITDEFTYGIHGDFSGQWATTAMTKEEDSNLWTLTFVPEKENAEFGVKKLKGEEQAAWLCAAVTFNEENPSAELTGGGNCIFGFPVNKEYKATYNPETNVLSFVATGNEPVVEYPETLYMLGTVNGNSWAANEGVKMEKIGEAKYQVENVDIHNGAGIEGEPAVGNFSFATSLGADATDWDGLGKRYGNAGADNEEWNVSTTAVFTGDIAVGDHAIQVPAAKYVVTVDLEAMTVTLLWSGATGISSISADADDAIYFNLQGVRVHNPESGLYIKVVNGESKKVLVK